MDYHVTLNQKRRRLPMRRLILLVILALLSTNVYAEHGLIRDLDQNGDSKLSWEEAQDAGWNKTMFDLKDMDKDGFINEKDLWDHTEWLKAPAVNSKIIQAMDTNVDGQIQRDEWWWGEDFSNFDLNKNGLLDTNELAKIPVAKSR